MGNNQIGGAELANKFEANATHVRIPLRELLVAGYSMSNPMVQEHETGVVTMSFAPNPRSIVTPFAQSWTDEKYHTLTYDGPWTTLTRGALKQSLRRGLRRKMKRLSDCGKGGLGIWHLPSQLSV